MVTGAAGAAWGTGGAVTGAAAGAGICGTVGGEGRVAVISAHFRGVLEPGAAHPHPADDEKMEEKETTAERTTVLLGASSSEWERGHGTC